MRNPPNTRACAPPPPPCRPRLREAEAGNAELRRQLAALEQECGSQLQAIAAEHELLRQQCQRWEGEVRRTCALHGEPVPRGLPPGAPPA